MILKHSGNNTSTIKSGSDVNAASWRRGQRLWRNGSSTGRVSVVRCPLSVVAPAFDRRQRSPCAGVCQRVDRAENLKG